MIDFSGLEQQYKLPQGLLSAVMKQESGGNPNAISSAGAVGAFQFMPATAQQYGIDPRDPNQSAQGAARMFGDLSQKYQGDLPKMLAGYNWGQGNVDRQGLQNAPPETQNYISSITNNLGQQGGIAQDTLIGNSGTPKIDLLLEAEKRGILPPDKKALLDEARSRGLITGGTPQKQPDIAPSMGRTVLDQSLQGATAGFADEPMDFLGAAYAKYAPEIIGGRPDLFKDQSLADTYADTRNASQQRMTSEFQNNPGTAIVSNIAGGLLTGKAIGSTGIGESLGNVMKSGGTLARIGKGALAGAATGGLYGAGSAEEGGRLQGAEMGAATGGVLGGALPAAGAFASGVKNEIQSLLPKSVQSAIDLRKSAAPLYDNFTKSGGVYSDKLTNEIADLADSAKSTGIAGQQKPADEALNKALDFYSSLRGAKLSPADLQKLDQSFTDDVSRFNRAGEYNFGRILNDLKYEMRDKAFKNTANYIDTGGVDVEKLHSAIDEWGNLKELERHLINTVDNTAKFAGQQSGFWRRDTITRAAEDAKNLANVKKQIASQEGLIQHLESAKESAAPDISSLLKANKLWSQSYKVKDVEKILQKAQGTETPQTSIRTGIKNLLANDKKMIGYSDQDKAILQEAMKRGYTGGLVKLFGGRLTDSLAGGAAGLTAGGPVGGALGMVAGKGVGGVMADAAGGIQANRLRGGLQSILQGNAQNVSTPITTGIIPAMASGNLSDLSNKLKKMGAK